MGFSYEVFMAFLDTSCYGLRTWLQGCMLACSHAVMCGPLVTVTVTVTVTITVRRYTQLDRCIHEQTNTCAIAQYYANEIRNLEGHCHKITITVTWHIQAHRYMHKQTNIRTLLREPICLAYTYICTTGLGSQLKNEASGYIYIYIYIYICMCLRTKRIALHVHT